MQEGDVIEIVVDTVNLQGSVDLVGHGDDEFGASEGERRLSARELRSDLAEEDALPDDTRLWAALQDVGGGTWGGCVYDVDGIIEALAVARRRQE